MFWLGLLSLVLGGWEPAEVFVLRDWETVLSAKSRRLGRVSGGHGKEAGGSGCELHSPRFQSWRETKSIVRICLRT